MTSTRNGRMAVIFFLVYLLLYLGFMLTNVFAPEVMERTPLAGVNLAIWYGFGLIFSAIALAFVYGILCVSSTPAPPVSAASADQKSGGAA